MKKQTLSFVTFIASALAAFAQPDPPELVEIREEHLRSMQRVVIPALNTYKRQLEAQKSAFVRQRKVDAARSVDDELKEIDTQLEVANNAVSRPGLVMQLTILDAEYGDFASKRVLDITKALQKAMESGAPTIKLHRDDAAGGEDPAPLVRKETLITYTINGHRKQRTFDEGHKLNFKYDLR
ncbi:hypothetical protein FEM03_13970 [Phragmitibacter flavus]|uniref:OmpH family outer membrane protein n=1 Tax=Phragmitibacter flavus TaxID=2576071 RepID=A0A5R8KDH1_9BACT|nr:hypothetical protein [Phragmitibacter flavus]TLD70287.1 hypothetical protein FEM03_13970 [Phragmitibacter flavus]